MSEPYLGAFAGQVPLPDVEEGVPPPDSLLAPLVDGDDVDGEFDPLVLHLSR